MVDTVIALTWNEGHGSLILQADDFFPLNVEKMRKFEIDVLRITDKREQVEKVLSYLKEEALPYWTKRAEDKTDGSAALKVKQVKSNIRVVERTLCSAAYYHSNGVIHVAGGTADDGEG